MLRPCLRATSRMAAQGAHIHNVAATGFAQGTNDLYDRARPSYPASALQRIRALVPGQQLTILEPGAGTGIFSRLLLQPPSAEYPSFDLKALVGIEPSDGMRDAWERGMTRLQNESLAGKDVRVVDGTFDDFSNAKVAHGSVDAIIIAQAWHWCPDHEKALTEIASYLRPGAPLILVWNIESNQDAWHAQLRETYEPLDLGSPQYYRGRWRAMFDTKAYKELFKAADEEHFKWDMGMNEQQVVDRIFSKSYMTEAHLNGEKRKAVEAHIRKVVQEGDKDWVDKDQGIFKYKYTTDIFILHRV